MAASALLFSTGHYHPADQAWAHRAAAHGRAPRPRVPARLMVRAGLPSAPEISCVPRRLRLVPLADVRRGSADRFSRTRVRLRLVGGHRPVGALTGSGRWTPFG